MASGISRSAKSQTWSRDDRDRQVAFVRGALLLLVGAQDVFSVDRTGKRKLVALGTGQGKRQPRTALRFLRDNAVTICFPREQPPEPEGLKLLRELNADVEELNSKTEVQ